MVRFRLALVLAALSYARRLVADSRHARVRSRVGCVRLRAFSAGLVALAVTGALLAAPVRSEPAASQLGLRAELKSVGDPAVLCPPGSSDSLMCPVRDA